MQKAANGLDKSSVIPIYHQLYTILLDRIEDGEYKAHEQLPSENELCNNFQVSRSTAQKALQVLVDQGFAYRVQGKGTYISDKMITYSITASLSFSAEIIGLKKSPQSKLIHEEKVPASERIARKLKINKGDEIYSIQRVRFVDKIPMAIQTSYLPKKLVPGLIDYEFDEGSLFKTIKNNYGHEISDAHETLKAIRCDTYEANLLKLHEGDAVFLLERTTKLHSGKMLEFVRTILRGDKSKFSIELSNTSNNKGKFIG
jgi:GntR family transcriptional regulator